MVPDRLKLFIKFKGISTRKFEQSIGAGNGFLSGKQDSIRSDKLTTIYKRYPELSISWLLTGEGDMLNPTTYKDNKIEESNRYRSLQRPYIPSLLDGINRPRIFSESIERWEGAFMALPIDDFDFSLTAHDDSMKDDNNSLRTISKGDFLACKLWDNQSGYRYGEIYALNVPAGIIIRLVEESERENYLRCLPLSSDTSYSSYDIPEEDITESALVVGVVSIKTWM